MASLVDVVSPEEFFREQLVDALSSQGLKVNVDVEHYLVSLLCRFVSPQKIVFEEREYHPTDIPLAFLLKEALDSDVENRARHFRTLGDISLYVSGFFHNFFRRKSVDLGYFISVGSAAYSNASVLAAKNRSKDSKRAVVFHDLAQSFPCYVDVVGHVSDGFANPSDIDLLAMYERWKDSRSERLLKKLKSEGIVPIANAKKK